MKTEQLQTEWKEIALGDKDYFEIVGSGIDKFTGEKEYLSTESIKRTKIEKIECKINYNNKPSRANMQPIMNSVWFAKMKSTIKVYYFSNKNEEDVSRYILSTGFAGVRFGEDISSDYIKFFFLTRRFNEEKDKLSTGSTQIGINNSFITKIKVFLPFSNGKPDLKEQERIVKILEKAEKLKERGKKAEELLDEHLKSVFVEMFGNYFKDRSKLKKITFFCSEDRNSIKAGPFGSSLKKECYVKEGYKIYGQEQVIKDDLNFGNYYIDKAKYKELENYKVQEGDILISLVGTYGKISMVPKNFKEGIINPRLMKITLDKKKMLPIFFKYLFTSTFISSQLKKVSHGGTMDIVNVGLIKNIDFPEVPLPLQQKFSKIVEQVEKMKEDVKKTKQNSEELFNSLMNKAFRGEL